MTKSAGGRHSFVSVVFILTIFFLLAILSESVILAGSNVYKKIAVSMDENYEKRVSLSYIATKIRQNDVAGCVYAENINGIETLALKEDYDGFEFVTYLYYYDGYIREIYLDMYEGSTIDFEPGDGDAVIRTEGMDFKVSEGRVEISVKDTKGRVQTLTIALRSR